MKDKRTYLFFLVLWFAFPAWGAGVSPAHWTFDPAEYDYDMNLHAALTFSGVTVEDYATMEVAAFCGDECRGIAKASSAQGKLYYEFRIYSKTVQGDVITFKCYNQSTGRELKISEEIVFDGEQHGTLSNLFQLSSTQPVTGITLDQNTVTLNTKDTRTLVVTVGPSDASNQSVTWKSNDVTIATVDDSGIITGVKAGQAVIAVTTVDGNFTATCAVTVLQPVTGISLNKTETVLKVNESMVLQITITPEDATNKRVTWSSSNEDIVTVDSDGKLTAIAIGESTITVITDDREYTKTCHVTVEPIWVESVQIDCEEDQLILNEEQRTLHFRASVLPEDATRKEIVWSVESGQELASITEEGLLTATGMNKDGTVVVRATVSGQPGVYAEISVKVIGLETGIKDQISLNLIVSPSPVKDRLYIRGDFTVLKDLCIINTSGHTCIVVKTLLPDEYIDVSSLPDDVYTVIMTLNEDVHCRKILKMN